MIRTKRMQPLLIEAGLLIILLGFATCLRVIAAFYAGTEVDEPIYRFAASYFLHYGFPAVRPAYGLAVIPFLYHPPFGLMLLGEWFRLWGDEQLLTGRMFSVMCSLIMMAILYLFLAVSVNRRTALLSLMLIAVDPWLIFTNQAIYLENSLMILIVLFITFYWRACAASSAWDKERLGRYLVAGLLLGFAIIWKHIGGFLLIGVIANMLLLRRHLHGHLLMLGVTLLVMMAYGYGMHCWFGELYDHATLVQINRTFWDRSSPGLNYTPLDALSVIYSRYYIFPITIVTLACGALVTLVRYVQYLLRKRSVKEGHPVIVTWALGGLAFAAGSSLKSPHYMILWLIPLYVLLAIEGVPLFTRIAQSGRAQQRKRLLIVGCASLLLTINMWSFKMRFLNGIGDTLAMADAYVNTHVPASAVVVTEDYFGVDIDPQYINISDISQVNQILHSPANYVVLYWSTTEPLPGALRAVQVYCTNMATFSGFKDHVEVCKINKPSLAKKAHMPEHKIAGKKTHPAIHISPTRHTPLIPPGETARVQTYVALSQKLATHTNERPYPGITTTAKLAEHPVPVALKRLTTHRTVVHHKSFHHL